MPWYNQTWFLCLVTFIPLFSITIALSLLNVWPPKVGSTVTTILLIVVGLVNISVGWWGLGIIYEELNLLHAVLSLFVPFYIIFPIIWKWHAMKQFFFASLALTLVGILGQVAAVITTVATAFGEA